ncbi:GMC family oxidoreductase [Labrys okinawensis]|uniref:GMC family oxidoreductase n=1 Tax=Labrys okinawensis TaxID=346911 RepID=UPI0039BCA721
MLNHAEFDYVIVGGGAAGCLLAARLSEDAGRRVALLEAGGRDNTMLVTIPAGFWLSLKTGFYNWNYSTEPQKHLNNRVIYWPRGKIIGGSGAINGMVYIRGVESDYDTWAQYGNRGWSYRDCLPFFKKTEGWFRGSNDYHNADGPFKVTRFGVKHPLQKAFVEACQQAGFPYNDDFNAGDQEGVGPLDCNISDARRVNTARALLHPAMARGNLSVVTRTLATKVLIEGGRATGVEVLQNGERRRFHAAHEVILSAGAVNSPQLLQLSGIGPPDHLRALGVKLVADLPGVGENLQDHLVAGLKQKITQPISFMRGTEWHNVARYFVQYLLTRSGPAAYHGVEAIAFLRSRKDLADPDLQIHMTNMMYEDNGRRTIKEHGFMPYFNLSRPESRGYIRIKSVDPRQYPEIQPNYFERQIDIDVMRAGFRMCREIIDQRAFDRLRAEELSPGRSISTDAEIDAWLRANAETIYHPVGTCKMGRDEMAVVDDRFRVRGVERLRVIDASIMPTLVSGNTQAPTVMIAERGAEFIRNPEL